jgi:hypothetical protein
MLLDTKKAARTAPPSHPLPQRISVPTTQAVAAPDAVSV